MSERHLIAAALMAVLVIGVAIVTWWAIHKRHSKRRREMGFRRARRRTRSSVGERR